MKTNRLWLALAVAAALNVQAQDASKAQGKPRSGAKESGAPLVITGSVPYVETVRRFVTKDQSPRIVGGRDAIAGERPWQVALVVAWQPDNLEAQFCGGTLVAPEWVVTAAHCVDKGLKEADVQIAPGILSLRQPNSKRIKVEKITIHSGWNPRTQNNDIAVLKLQSPAPADAATRAIPYDRATDDPQPNIELAISGWGATSEGGAGSVILKTIDLPIVDRTTCNKAPSYGGRVTENMICAGKPEGKKDSCQGDSGGPAVRDPGTKPTLVGVVSWGDGCARELKYGIYTRVNRYAKWIEGIMGSVGAPPRATKS